MTSVTRNDLELRLDLIRNSVSVPSHGVWGPASMLWRVDRELLMYIGGARALLLQIAHPWVAAGVVQHSKVFQDPFGRFARTMDTVSKMVFSDLDTALKSARATYNIHSKVHGTTAQGEGYQANNQDALMWVHATLWETSVFIYEMYVGPLSDDEKEKFYNETKFFAYLFGISEEALPKDWESFVRYNEDMWAYGLKVTPEAVQISEKLFSPSVLLKPPGLYYRSLTKTLLPLPVAAAFNMIPNDLDYANSFAFRKLVKKSLPLMPDVLRFSPKYRSAMTRIGNP